MRAIEEGAELGRGQLAAAVAAQRGVVERRWIAGERDHDQAVGIHEARIEEPEQRLVVEGSVSEEHLDAAELLLERAIVRVDAPVSGQAGDARIRIADDRALGRRHLQRLGGDLERADVLAARQGGHEPVARHAHPGEIAPRFLEPDIEGQLGERIGGIAERHVRRRVDVLGLGRELRRVPSRRTDGLGREGPVIGAGGDRFENLD